MIGVLSYRQAEALAFLQVARNLLEPLVSVYPSLIDYRLGLAGHRMPGRGRQGDGRPASGRRRRLPRRRPLAHRPRPQPAPVAPDFPIFLMDLAFPSDPFADETTTAAAMLVSRQNGIAPSHCRTGGDESKASEDRLATGLRGPGCPRGTLVMTGQGREIGGAASIVPWDLESCPEIRRLAALPDRGG